MSTTARFSFIS